MSGKQKCEHYRDVELVTWHFASGEVQYDVGMMRFDERCDRKTVRCREEREWFGLGDGLSGM
jgi:hypothetical protein